MTIEWTNRIKRLHQVCNIYPDKPNLLREYRSNIFKMNGTYYDWHMEPMSMIDEEHGLLYCDLPKFGSVVL